jgi:O-antigen/teichoic acid export membrane protein
LSATTAYACVAAAALVTGAMWVVRNRRDFLVERARVLADAAHNWRFSRWLVASQIWFMGRIAVMPWIVAGMIDRSATGVYVACETIVMLANPLMIAAHNLLGPQSAHAFAEGGVSQLRRLVFRATMLLGAGTAALTLILLVVGETAMVLLLGESYAGHRGVLSVLLLTLFAEGLGMAATNGLCAIEQARLNLVAIVAGTIATIVLALTLIPLWGLTGAALASLAGRMVTSTCAIALFVRFTGRLSAREASA